MRRWRAWGRLGERERRLRGLGVVDGYGRQGEREARWGLWGEGVVDMGRGWCASRLLGERERRWQGLGVGVAYGRRGTGSPTGLVGTGGDGHGAAVARVVVPGGAGAAGSGPRGIVVAPWRAAVARVSG